MNALSLVSWSEERGKIQETMRGEVERLRWVYPTQICDRLLAQSPPFSAPQHSSQAVFGRRAQPHETDH